jgi:hypothetical protein
MSDLWVLNLTKILQPHNLNLQNGHAMAQAVRHRKLTAEARVTVREMCGGQSGSGERFFFP